MALRTFEVNITREYEYKITLDDERLDAEFMKNFNENMWKVNSLEEHAKFLAEYNSRYADDDFIEGYGEVKIIGVSATTKENEGITINLLSEDWSVYVEEIKP